MTNIINPVIVLGGLGLLFGVLLSIASKIFVVAVNPKVEEVLGILPGANCGACGYPGCAGCAAAIVEGQAPTTACTIGGAKVAAKVADAMGVNAGAFNKKVAVVKCQGDCDKAKDKYIYQGIADCRIQSTLAGGQKECTYGCLGCGTCFDVCKFNAIRMIDGIAVVNKENCTACNACVVACPKNIIELIPYESTAVVKCMSQDKGKEVRGYCSVGCIGCQICVKNCPTDAFTFENNLARINYEKCIDCLICVEKCPTKAIDNMSIVSEEFAKEFAN